jgi:hypothetical protein
MADRTQSEGFEQVAIDPKPLRYTGHAEDSITER